MLTREDIVKMRGPFNFSCCSHSSIRSLWLVKVQKVPTFGEFPLHGEQEGVARTLLVLVEILEIDPGVD